MNDAKVKVSSFKKAFFQKNNSWMRMHKIRDIDMQDAITKLAESGTW